MGIYRISDTVDHTLNKTELTRNMNRKTKDKLANIENKRNKNSCLIQ